MLLSELGWIRFFHLRPLQEYDAPEAPKGNYLKCGQTSLGRMEHTDPAAGCEKGAHHDHFHARQNSSATQHRDRCDTSSDITMRAIVSFTAHAISLADYWDSRQQTADLILQLFAPFSTQLTSSHDKDCPPKVRTRESHASSSCEHIFFEVFFVCMFVSSRPFLWAFNQVYLESVFDT